MQFCNKITITKITSAIKLVNSQKISPNEY